MANLVIRGMPQGISETTAAVCRSRLLRDVGDMLTETGLKDVEITVTTSPNSNSSPKQVGNNRSDSNEEGKEFSVEKLAEKYESDQPLYKFDQLVVGDDLREDLLSAIDLIRVEPKVFDEWGLRIIEPFPRTALNFHGAPGTGKTLAAHAIANKLDKKILLASYAAIESPLLGVGTKNLEAVFYAASRDNAVLFLDEADSLLSKRITSVSQGSERAANAMCSQLLICLEKFHGVVIFATNLVENYDRAFETRVRHIQFPMPNTEARAVIWRKHLPGKLPLAANVSIENLAEIEDVCGRDIKNAVIDAAIRTARNNKECVEMQELVEAVNRIKSARISVSGNSRKLTPEEEAKVKEKLKEALSKQENASNQENNGSSEKS
ncbi:ATP-binding protein [Planktothrix agardhii 1029]|uniref:FtsH n=1 Tax=Planktothrix agardhii (strain NIVA-CYA 126/8) TaxID=388467 RepID=A0A073CAU5_PLAA1|nr:ATP-binding protein [Planktothrix agardhii]KEI65226.1 FtsH [Planktothrix agardhii NIVA-CYA 126/8]MCB8766569.1 ATP-binding protein [Planktothrix agardhii 1809]MCB8780105.1 ATP-binding protein [Planktothrix agardhii 1031]MCB8784580.1 ATP-binding protein [Planktothrix agardhii 1808]MCF3568769.1 ATP-binding protein [Planktothrix agardhii 1807]